jgi:SAM-dependent methyltransferase
MDWVSWHAGYDHPGSDLARRLRVVQEQVRLALATCPPGQLRVISVCAGQGRDLIEVLAGHPRRRDVRARLVELDPRNAALAAEAARSEGLDRVEVVVEDAALTDNYQDLAPADLLLVCGVFGNVTDEDIERTVAVCPQLCRPGGTVVWSRHRDTPDPVPRICEWFEQRGFERQWLSKPDQGFGVGVHRYTGQPQRLELGLRMFRFVGYDMLRRADASG